VINISHLRIRSIVDITVDRKHLLEVVLKFEYPNEDRKVVFNGFNLCSIVKSEGVNATGGRFRKSMIKRLNKGLHKLKCITCTFISLSDNSGGTSMFLTYYPLV
jgi:hypothetical protein